MLKKESPVKRVLKHLLLVFWEPRIESFSFFKQLFLLFVREVLANVRLLIPVVLRAAFYLSFDRFDVLNCLLAQFG